MATIVVHGGAARIASPDLSAHQSACTRAVERGLSILRSGGSALDAAIAAVVVLEDDPVTNAGTGSVLNRDGVVEMDALAMEGTTLRLGAVAGVRDLKNPVLAARRLLEEPALNFLIGADASRWAESHGINPIDPRSLLLAARRRASDPPNPGSTACDTVGAVACDDGGRVASAVSTGGISDKVPGRVGDAALVGSGAYADDRVGAAVATGVGEGIMRVLLAHAALDQLARGLDPMAAAGAAIAMLGERVGGSGGVIVVDRAGRAGYAFNTEHMSWGIGHSDDGSCEVGY